MDFEDRSWVGIGIDGVDLGLAAGFDNATDDY